ASVTFSYPLTELRSSFLGFAPSPLVDLTPEELCVEFDKVKALREEFPVLNPRASLEEMQRFARGERQRFECFGGYRYFYLDWELMLWRCHFWEAPLCSIYDMDETKLVRDGCTRCMIDCFRDSSVMQKVAVSASDALQDLRRGKLLAAMRKSLRRENV